MSHRAVGESIAVGKAGSAPRLRHVPAGSTPSRSEDGSKVLRDVCRKAHCELLRSQ